MWLSLLSGWFRALLPSRVCWTSYILPVPMRCPSTLLFRDYLRLTTGHVHTMAIGAILEPLVVVLLLIGGTWINRSRIPRPCRWQKGIYRSAGSLFSVPWEPGRPSDPADQERLLPPRSWSPSLLCQPEDRWHKRQLRIFPFRFEATSPNTTVFQDRLLSRLLQKLPFLVECWYWALVYWVGSLYTL